MVATSLSLCNSSEKPVEKLPYSKGQPPKSAMLSRIMASGFLENFSARAQIVWAALWSHAGSCVAGASGDYFTERCWPSESQLARELGCDARTVRRAIKQLVSGGAVRRDRRGRRAHWHAGSVLVIPKVAIQANAPDRTLLSSRSTGHKCPLEKTKTMQTKPTSKVVVAHTTQEPAQPAPQPAQSPPARPTPAQPKQANEWRDATSAELDAVAALPLGRDGLRSKRAVEAIRAGQELSAIESAWLHGVIRSERPAVRVVKVAPVATAVAAQLKNFGMRGDLAEMLSVSMPSQALHWLHYAKQCGKQAGFIVAACREQYKMSA